MSTIQMNVLPINQQQIIQGPIFLVEPINKNFDGGPERSNGQVPHNIFFAGTPSSLVKNIITSIVTDRNMLSS